MVSCDSSNRASLCAYSALSHCDHQRLLARWRARDNSTARYIAILGHGRDKSPGAVVGLSFFARHASFHYVEPALNGWLFRASRASSASALEMS